jgi:ParB family chromosome partitioning protein
MSTLRLIPFDQIDESADNRAIGDITELTASIKAIGIVEAPTVTPRGERFLLVSGHRRVAAAKEAGVTEAWCQVRETEEPERIEAQLVANLLRKDLTPIEEARGYQALAATGMKQRTIAERTGKSQAHISKRLSLLHLPAQAHELLDSGGITIDGALELTKLVGHDDAMAAALKSARGHGASIGWAVERELRAIEKTKREEASRKEAASKGLRLLDRDSQWDHIPWGVDEDAHAAKECHAVVLWYDGTLHPVCTAEDPEEAHAEEIAAAEEKLESARQEALADARSSRANNPVNRRAEEERERARLAHEAAEKEHSERQVAIGAVLSRLSQEELLEVAWMGLTQHSELAWETVAGIAGVEWRHGEWQCPEALAQKVADGTVGVAWALACIGAAECEIQAEVYEDTEDWVSLLGRHGATSDGSGVVPDSPEPVIEDYPAEDRPQILADAANEALAASEHATGEQKAQLERQAEELVAQAHDAAQELDGAELMRRHEAAAAKERRRSERLTAKHMGAA